MDAIAFANSYKLESYFTTSEQLRKATAAKKKALLAITAKSNPQTEYKAIATITKKITLKKPLPKYHNPYLEVKKKLQSDPNALVIEKDLFTKCKTKKITADQINSSDASQYQCATSGPVRLVPGIIHLFFVHVLL